MAEKTIKSVRRVFEIFELFENLRRPLSAKEFADELRYPLASAHALMKSLCELGYVDFNAQKWTYFPTRKFSVLSDWMAEFVEHETRLIECMDALNRETKETINLSRLTGDHVKIIYGLECLQPVGVSVKVGTLMPATKSLTGMTALACLSENERSRFFDRMQSNAPNQPVNIDSKLIDEVNRELEQRGTVAKYDVFVQGIGAICMPVQTELSGDSMVIGVVGPSDRISSHQSRHRRTLKKILTKFGIKSQFTLRNPRTSQ